MMKKIYLIGSGIVGALLLRRFATKTRAERHIARAKEENSHWITEPDGPNPRGDRIDAYIRGPEGLMKSNLRKYVRNKQFPWCGAFTSWVFHDIKPEIRKRYFPGTAGLYSWARNTPRLIKPENLQSGDIILLGPQGGDIDGDHIAMVDQVFPDHVTTYEGNTNYRKQPGNIYYIGVAHKTRPFAHSAKSPKTFRVLWGIRPLEEDYFK
jgi:hypothetical protein